MSIESKQYVASASDIERLAGEIIDSNQVGETGRGTYLKALVATTQSELGVKPRARNTTAARLTEDETAAQLKAFNSVAQKFYQAVMHAADNTVPTPDKAMLRSRTAFARSAGSTVRSYIRAGNDITSIAAARVTKAQLAVPHASRRRVSVPQLRGRIETLASAIQAAARNLVAMNRETAREVLAPVVAKLTAQLQAAGAELKHTRTGVIVPNVVELRSRRAA